MKDYQLVQKGGGQDCGTSQAQLSQYSQHFAFIASHLLQTSMDSHCPEAVEATWVLSLALKGLYKTLKVMVSLFHLHKPTYVQGINKEEMSSDLDEWLAMNSFEKCLHKDCFKKEIELSQWFESQFF